MNPIFVGIIGGLAVIALISLRIPMGLGLALVGWVGTWLVTGNFEAAFKLLTTTPYYSIATFSLVVVPLFIMMGAIALYGDISSGSFVAARNWLGKLPGSLSVATIWACVAFGAASGSSIATSTVFTRISLPEMRKAHYEVNTASACIATAGIIAMLIPPSILLVFYGLFTEQSVAKLLIAGFTPGILLAICLTLGVVFQAMRNPTLAPVDTTQISWEEKFRSIIGVWPAALLILIVLGGIYSGVFSPTEAGATGCFAALIITFIKRRLTWKVVRDAALETARFSTILFVIFIGATLFSRFLTVSGFTEEVAKVVVGLGLPAIGMVIIMMLIYLVLGCFLDSVSSMAITLPIIFGPLVSFGVDPIWFGVLTVFCLNIGKITPPMGMDVFAVKAVAGADVTVEGIFRACVPFLIVCLIALTILVLFPEITLFLPRKMFS